MNRNKFYLLRVFIPFLILFGFCTPNSHKDYHMEITITDKKTFSADFSTGQFTMYYENDSSQSVNLNLSKAEKKKIVDSYYSSGIDTFPSALNPGNDCFSINSDIVKVVFKTKEKTQTGEINFSCNKVGSTNVEAGILQKFVNGLIQLLINNKQVKTLKKLNPVII